MRLFSEDTNYKLYQGNMLDMLDIVEENSVASIVTDPPYELNFMGKGWDNSGIAFQKETWEKCYKVLKPGGYLLAFGGSRTFHRIACAIEDAGFEIRDTIMWLYGCYSDDTQVLTDKGWKYFYDLDKSERILQWDKDTNKLSWVNPLNYFEYDIDDELKLFENRHISQLVTKNHKVAVSVQKRRKNYEGYELIEADSIKKSWNLKFPCAGELDGSVHEDDAYIIGWWLTDAWAHKDGKACMFSQSKLTTLNKLRNWLDTHSVKYSEYVKHSDNDNHNDEHTFYVTGELADKLLSQYPNRELSWDMLNWDKTSRELLLEGLMDGDGSYRANEYSKTFWSKRKERCDIVQAICLSLNYRSYLNYKDGEISGVNFNIVHNSAEAQTKHRKPDVKYCGKVYCLQTETGAFVVRRNGKAFISGNSGFPKSMSLGKSIEAKLTTGSANTREFKNSEEGKKWQGWGTALKPAFEPIIVARKPCEGSCTDNVLKYGVGGINIDGCRIGEDEIISNGGRATISRGDDRTGKALGYNAPHESLNISHTGRFPSNVILTYDETDEKEVCGGMPQTSSGFSDADLTRSDSGQIYGFANDGNVKSGVHFGDSGSASRYFYCAKASAKDRDDGLEEFELAVGGGMQGTSDQSLLTGSGNIRNNLRKNVHPTVKPVDLMQYLVRLVTPKGGIVLDPFNGSGSTGKAVMYENAERESNYTYIGIELTEQYLPISKARLDNAKNYTFTAYTSVKSSNKKNYQSKRESRLF